MSTPASSSRTSPSAPEATAVHPLDSKAKVLIFESTASTCSDPRSSAEHRTPESIEDEIGDAAGHDVDCHQFMLYVARTAGGR